MPFPPRRNKPTRECLKRNVWTTRLPGQPQEKNRSPTVSLLVEMAFILFVNVKKQRRRRKNRTKIVLSVVLFISSSYCRHPRSILVVLGLSEENLPLCISQMCPIPCGNGKANGKREIKVRKRRCALFDAGSYGGRSSTLGLDARKRPLILPECSACLPPVGPK